MPTHFFNLSLTELQTFFTSIGVNSESQASEMRVLRTSKLGALPWHALASTTDHTQKSKGLRSGDEGGHFSFPQNESEPHVSRKYAWVVLAV